MSAENRLAPKIDETKAPAPTLKVMLIGGYGSFGLRLAELLSDEPRLHLMLAGRSKAKADAACAAFPARAIVTGLAVDRQGDLDAILGSEKPDIVIDATGPFQLYGSDPYRLVRACMRWGINYLDFADGRDFALNIRQFDAEARARGIFAISAASSCPALSAAAVRHLAKGLAAVEHVEGGIAPSPFAGIGLNVIRAILAYAGEPIEVTRDGVSKRVHGLTETRPLTLCVPGALPLEPRLFALVDVPDLETLPEAYPGLRSAWFGAGTAPTLFLRLLVLMARLRRRKLFPPLEPFAALFHRAANRLAWGEHRGGMFVGIRGRDASGTEIARSWHLVAEGENGPYIPCMAIDAIIRKCLDGDMPATGARPADRELELTDFELAFAKKSIRHGIWTDVDRAQPLYRRILGSAWHRLAGPIRDLHEVDTSRRFAGRASVDRGSGWIARLIGSLYGFPDAGAEIPVEVLLGRRDGGEIWQRTFAGRRFRSWQSEGKGASECLIDERFGPVSVGLAIVENEGRLDYHVRRWSFLGIPMPKAMAPGGRTFEHVENGRFCFHVEVAHPWFGLVVRYRGWLEPVVE